MSKAQDMCLPLPLCLLDRCGFLMNSFLHKNVILLKIKSKQQSEMFDFYKMLKDTTNGRS